MDRKEIYRALAKILAYKACNKPQEALKWFKTLTRLLGYDVYDHESDSALDN